MKTILVPVDFSKSSNNACKYAIAMAKEVKAEMILLHVFETPFIYSDVPYLMMQMDYSTLYNAASKRLKQYYNKIKKDARGIKIHLVIQQGLPSFRIKEIALEKNVDLIVMGVTGKGAIERVLIGSNTSRILRDTPCMVLAIPHRAKYSGFNKIVFATDLTDVNLVQSKSLIPFAKLFNSELLYLNVKTQSLVARKNDLLETVKVIKKHVPYPKKSGYVCYDIDVANGINYFLKKVKADCISMYAEHRSIPGIIFNPSKTKKVAVHTTIPLLVIHKKDHVME